MGEPELEWKNFWSDFMYLLTVGKQFTLIFELEKRSAPQTETRAKPYQLRRAKHIEKTPSHVLVYQLQRAKIH